MRSSRIWLVFWIVAIMAFGFGCGGKTAVEKTSEKVKLGYGKLSGKEVTYKLSSNMTYNFQKVERQALSEITCTVKVDSIHSDGAIDRTIKFEDFVMSEIGGSGKLESVPDLGKYKGEWLYLRLGPDGKLIDWKGLDGIRGHSVSDENLRDQLVLSMVSLFQPFTDEEVSIGSTWRREIEVPIGMRGGERKQKTTIDYEVEGFGNKDGRRCIKIKTKSRVEAEGEGEIGGKKFWVNVTGSGSGTIWFDYAEGLIVEEYDKSILTVDFSRERAGKEDVTTETGTLDVESRTKLIK